MISSILFARKTKRIRRQKIDGCLLCDVFVLLVFEIKANTKLIWCLVWNQMKLALCSIVAVFNYVQLFKRSISERSIVFDWQNFWVSSIS